MRTKRWGAVSAVCVAIALAWYYGIATPHGVAVSAMAGPADAALAGGTFQSGYLGLTFPLPRGWGEGPVGPPPSRFGDYVVGTLVPENKGAGTVVITAHDMFFADVPYENAAAMIVQFRKSAAGVPGMTIDREPAEVRIGGRAMERIDFSGVGLYRTMLATEIRCHLVRFNLTATEPSTLAMMVHSLDGLTFDARSDAASSVPVCVKDYATDETVLSKVQPPPAGPAFTPIPVRIIIGTNGFVKAVHVIHATAEQRQNIETAFRQWRFKPLVMNGRNVEVETGLVFQFTTHRS
jgi:hypothetical protein